MSVTTPQAQTGGDDTTRIQNAVATNSNVDLGSHSYAIDGTGIGALKPDRFVFGRHAILSNQSTIFTATLGNRSQVAGAALVGAGNGSALNRGLGIPDDVGGTLCDMVALDFGGPAWQNFNNACRKGDRVTGYFENNAIALDIYQRGEYTTAYGFSITSAATVPGVHTGVKLRGGNTMLVGGSITNQAVAVDVVPGTNDAHSAVVGVMLNHNDVAVRVGDINVKDFVVSASKVYAAAVHLEGSKGVLFTGCGLGDWTVKEKGCDEVAFTGNIFQTMPTITHNADSAASCVHYYGNLLPASVPGDHPMRQATAVSKRTVSEPGIVAAETAVVVDFDTAVINALQSNSSFSKHELWNNTHKCWSMLSFASPASSGKAEPDIQLTLGAGSVFADEQVDVYLSLRDSEGDEVERRYFHRSGEHVDCADRKRVFTFNGAVPKHARMSVVVDNRSGSNVTLFADDGPRFPSAARVCGW